MCGIVAFIGEKKSASKIIFNGLKLLEYRGYDSSGISLIKDNEFKTFKKKGRVKESENLYNKNQIKANIGIGHTRWATHGEPSDINSHPIESYNNEFAIVHNGIIENFKELKSILIDKGIDFKTNTDTEVLINFIEMCIYESGNIDKGLSFALSKVEGAYGIVIIKRKNPELMYAARRGSPLAFGKINDDFIIASDAKPIVEYTKKIMYLDNDQILKICNNDFEILDLDLI